jgi:hypothetical protein
MFYRFRIVSVGGLLLSGATPSLLRAQLAPPVVVTTSPGTRPVAPVGAAYHVAVKERQLDQMVSFRDTHYPIDSMLKVIEALGTQWVTRLQQPSLKGVMTDLQHDPAGGVGMSAAQEAYAHAQIAARLAVPNLRMQDRAYTLQLAVLMFSNWRYPERLPTAERYLKQLDAMGDQAAAWQMSGRAILMNTYYYPGRSADIVRLGKQILPLTRKVPYLDGGVATGIYYKVVDAMGGLPDAPRQIKALTDSLRATYRPPPPELIAIDTGFIKYGQDEYKEMEEIIRRAAMLGAPGASLVSNYWVNRPTTDSAVIPVNDGKIRLIEVLSFGCDGCVHALFSLQRIQDKYPNTVQAIGTTFTMGWWANRLVTPDDEAQRLHDYFAKQLKLTIPIAIWKWPKVRGPNGGDEPAGVWDTPNGISYPLYVKPTTYLVDGNGRIRRVFFGGGRDLEEVMLQAVEFLLREAAAQAPSKTAASLVPTPPLVATLPTSFPTTRPATLPARQPQ